MKPTQAIAAITSQHLKENVPDFSVGDTVRVSVRVVEGSRERIQVFEGVVMRKRGGVGINANFTVRRIASHGIGVERTFLIHSPRVDKIEVIRRGVVRRAQLYYLRGLTGKAARIKERRYNPAAEAAKAARAAARAPVAPLPAAVATNGLEDEEELEEEEAYEATAELAPDAEAEEYDEIEEESEEAEVSEEAEDEVDVADEEAEADVTEAEEAAPEETASEEADVETEKT